jgi:hypothetical protein
MNQKLKELSEALKDSSQDAALKGIITQMHIAYYNDDLQDFNEAIEKVKSLYLKAVNKVNKVGRCPTINLAGFILKQ